MEKKSLCEALCHTLELYKIRNTTLARLTGISQNTISHLTIGRRATDTKKLQAIANALYQVNPEAEKIFWEMYTGYKISIKA